MVSSQSIFLILLLIFVRCTSDKPSVLVTMVRNYFTWRQIYSVLILSKDNGDNEECKFAGRFFWNCRSIREFSKDFRGLDRSKLGLVWALDGKEVIPRDFEELFEATMHLENLAWYIILEENSTVPEQMRAFRFGINIDLVIASRKSDHNEKINRTYELLQTYKIAKEDGTSVITKYLGDWDVENGTKNLIEFSPVEKRTNFHRFPLTFGKKNATRNLPSENIIEDDSDEERLIEFANYFIQLLNASEKLYYFQKLGHKEINGEWTDLLRAVVDEKVDIALERIVKTVERNFDMAFTHEILQSMRNIYVKPQASNELRDIFLAPFSTKLIICVTSTALILSILMAIVNKVTDKVKELRGAHSSDSLLDTIISCIGIFSMQGSSWLPSTYSGNIILITSLAFAELIFNSYSAFITSILSVETANIGSLDQLLASSYNIGYVKNGQDEIYLRFMNDTQLQQIYLRGYLANDVSNVQDGLLKSTKGHYAFFASANIARKELQAINHYRCNSELIEITIPKTKSTIAFPLSKRSPYRKIINLSILKMYETGVYKHLHTTIVPDFRHCVKSRVFRGAKLSDLMTAFAILLFGTALALCLLCLECTWRYKREIYQSLDKTVHELHHLGHFHEHH